ncbi:MAG: bifunctional 5,10-methylenetetrahydrofolate dehydrogenase/5,10-methenyltetrahydrofolate cyclohydrolase [Bdellovibrionales bacterium]|nr:bifunctional 5,10-methylenetetrahydrofolate dehydrogenase/5,10-methenyltetrahydrofolate cyclohydrolase [Bdellovibrionales bacterium]
MLLLDGKKLSEKILQDIHNELQSYKKDLIPCLAVCLIGEDLASHIYVENKIKACQKAGLKSVLKKFPSDCSKQELKKEILSLNQDPKIHGILVQLPLPPNFSKQEILSWLEPKKDVDGLTLENKALLWSGNPRVIPCTPKGILTLLKAYNVAIKGQYAVVIGRSEIVGLPLFQQLISHHSTVTLCHSYTKNLSVFCQKADLVFVCSGQRHLLSQKDFKKGAVVVDVGIHRRDKKLYGDVDPRGLENHLSAFTPVPGGVGPMTIASLLENTVQLAKKL